MKVSGDERSRRVSVAGKSSFAYPTGREAPNGSERKGSERNLRLGRSVRVLFLLLLRPIVPLWCHLDQYTSRECTLVLGLLGIFSVLLRCGAFFFKAAGGLCNRGHFSAASRAFFHHDLIELRPLGVEMLFLVASELAV